MHPKIQEGQGPRVLCVTPALYPPFVINIQQPLDILRAKGLISYTTRLERHLTAADIHESDVVLFFRNSDPSLLKYLYYSKALGKPVIYGVDDNFYELAHSGKGPMEPMRLDAHSRFIKGADTVMVYSNPMAERARGMNESVVKVVPGINFSALDGLQRKKEGDKVRIVYATSRYSNDILWEIFLPAVKRILAEYKGRVEMDFMGFIPSEMSGLPGVNFMPPQVYEDYIRELYTQGYDIGLAPLKDDLFHRSKTNTKFRDYGLCKVAGIYSNVDVYSDCVKDGVTGMLVENTVEAWYGAIRRLVEDKALREAIRQNAHEFVKNHYEMARVADGLYNIIGSLVKNVNVRDDSRCVGRRFLDLKTPAILCITSSGSDPVIGYLKEICGHYGYKARFSTAYRGPKTLSSSDIIVIGMAPANLRKDVADAASAMNKRVIISQDLPELSMEGLVNSMEAVVYDGMLKARAIPCRYTARRIWMHLSNSRRRISHCLFKR